MLRSKIIFKFWSNPLDVKVGIPKIKSTLRLVYPKSCAFWMAVSACFAVWILIRYFKSLSLNDWIPILNLFTGVDLNDFKYCVSRSSGLASRVISAFSCIVKCLWIVLNIAFSSYFDKSEYFFPIHSRDQNLNPNLSE